MKTHQPNVLFIFADQLRGSSVGYAGEESVITPNIDAFAKSGAIYRNAVSMLPVCGPFRGSLITGRTPTSTGLVINDIPLRTDEISVGHCFKDAGYDTAYIGKWHLDGPNRPAPVPPGPRRQGFDYWMGANFEHNYDRSYYTDNDGEMKMWEGWDAEAQTTHAIEYLKKRDGDNPFCLFLSWGPPHHPYRLVPQQYLDMYDPDKIKGRPNCPDVPTEDLWGYYAQTTFLDDQFQRLLDAVDEMGIADDTVVVFSSDHGDMHGSHGVYKKQWPWNEASKIPFAIRYPRRIPAGQVIDAPINVIDFMPTLLGLAGVPVPDTVEGVDLSPYLTCERNDPPESVLIMNPCPFSIGDSRGHDQYPDYKGKRLEYRGVITGRYTYVRTIDGPWLLYDNAEDPYQMNNLVDDEGHADTRARLEKMMQAHMEKIGDEMLPRERYYERFNIVFDHRGKVIDLVENMYDRKG
ncbi:MAG: sulfatase [Rhodospirillales bacterium]|nr:sulfatase [Rhodospirillales bacterium]